MPETTTSRRQRHSSPGDVSFRGDSQRFMPPGVDKLSTPLNDKPSGSLLKVYVRVRPLLPSEQSTLWRFDETEMHLNESLQKDAVRDEPITYRLLHIPTYYGCPSDNKERTKK
jgi:hypothetical protein